MNWIIERDKEGWPIHMTWAGPGPSPTEKALERQREAERNALPMPAMREWAKARGLTT